MNTSYRHDDNIDLHSPRRVAKDVRNVGACTEGSRAVIVIGKNWSLITTSHIRQALLMASMLQGAGILADVIAVAPV